jgi:uncharacterized protein
LISLTTHGIQVAPESGAHQGIPRVSDSTVAFIGRTLRGPLNKVVTVTSFAEYQAVFGGLWQPSTLSYAVEQYFENGGVRARIVRVANGARPATIRLPVAGAEALVLEARCPGTREFLRASVDHDNIATDDRDSFNLVVHRVRSPGSEHVEDQEIYTRASVHPESPRNISVLLAESSLVRLRGPVPLQRPKSTERGDLRAFAAYEASSPDGDDGAPITDYDLIGSATERSGLFALGEQDDFSFLYLPPLGREHPVGASALLVAARLCRSRNALLMVDPPSDWSGPLQALNGVRETPHASEQALMYYPWIQAYDRLRGRFEVFPPGAAALGILGRLAQHGEAWAPGRVEEGPLRPGFRPACAVSEEQRGRLAAVGLNVLQAARSPRPLPARTLAGARASVAEWRYLARRRLALQVIESIVRGTRWVLFEPYAPAIWRRLGRQVGEFLARYEHEGAFADAPPGGAWFVVCDERVNPPRAQPLTSVLFGYTAGREGTWICWLLTQDPAGARVRHTSLNQLQSAGGRPPLDPDFDVATLLQEHFRD